MGWTWMVKSKDTIPNKVRAEAIKICAIIATNRASAPEIGGELLTVHEVAMDQGHCSNAEALAMAAFYESELPDINDLPGGVSANWWAEAEAMLRSGWYPGAVYP